MADTDTTTTDVQADEPKTSPLPGGSVGIHMANGELVDPTHLSVKGLVRAGEQDYERVLSWLRAERERFTAERAERLAQVDTSAIRRDAEARERTLEAAKAARPWAFE